MGHNEYGLKSLADDQLLAGLASIVQRRNQITAEFLAYLAELDERQLFLDLGFSSLFEFCVETLKLCESTAGRHIAAARVCRSHPKVFAMVASGALHASALSLLRKHLTRENAEELFELCTHRSTRKVEELLAERFPRPDVRDLVRRLPARAPLTPDVERSTAQAPMQARSQELRVEPPSQVAEARLVSQSAESPTGLAKPRRPEPLSPDRYGVHFTADSEFCALLERVRGLAGHRLPSGDLMTLLKRGLEAYERELEKERFAVGGNARRSREVAPASGELPVPEVRKSEPTIPALPKANLQPKFSRLKRKRCYTAAVRRAVYQRDGAQCTYVSSDGRRCRARRCLELDHIEPFAVGGEASIENLRLRCRAHNQRYARQYFGVSRLNAVVQAFRRRRASVQGKRPRCEEGRGQVESAQRSSTG